MQIYRYDHVTGVYLGDGVADPHPFRVGEFLLPAFATPVPPPAVAVGERARYSAGVWIVEPIPPLDQQEPSAPETAAELVAYAALRRWLKEVSGVTVSGISVATDDRSKIMIIGARVAAEADANWQTTWIGANGDAYPVDASAMIAISAAVQAHVNACFVTFAALRAGILAGEVTTAAEIDAAFAGLTTAY
jgi:hypothetical protein